MDARRTAERVLMECRGDYIRAWLKKYQRGLMTAQEYAEVMNELNCMFMDAISAQERMAELNDAMRTQDENDDPMSYDDWECIFLNEVMA